MTPATLSALLLMAAGLLHSFSFMCRKLPPERCPRLYPRHRGGQIALDLGWVGLFLTGISLALLLSTPLGITAGLIYFIALPFVFQPSLARMLGFKDLQDYVDTIDRQKKD